MDGHKYRICNEVYEEKNWAEFVNLVQSGDEIKLLVWKDRVKAVRYREKDYLTLDEANGLYKEYNKRRPRTDIPIAILGIILLMFDVWIVIAHKVKK